MSVTAETPAAFRRRGGIPDAYGWDDLSSVLALTGDANHIHIPGSPLEWEHNYVPISEAAAKSHGGGKVPKGWHAPKGGSTGKPSRPPTLKSLAAKHGMRTMEDNYGSMLLPKGGGIVSPVLRERGGHFQTVNGEDVDPHEADAFVAAYKQNPKAFSGGLLDQVRSGGGSGKAAPKAAGAKAAEAPAAPAPPKVSGYVKDFKNPATAAEDAKMRQALKADDYDTVVKHLQAMDKLEKQAGVGEGEGLRPKLAGTIDMMKTLKQGKQRELKELPKQRGREASRISDTAGQVITAQSPYIKTTPERAAQVQASLREASNALMKGDHEGALQHLATAKEAAKGPNGTSVMTGGHDGRGAASRIADHEKHVQQLAADAKNLARYAPAPKGGRAVKTAYSQGDLPAISLASPSPVKTPSPKAPPARPAGKPAAVPPVPPPPSRRSRITPLTPMRVQAAKSMSKLADSMRETHPDMLSHQHVRDAARMLRAGNEEAAQRHLRAAMFSLTPQSLMRHGLHTDDAHMAARQAMHGAHRHLLLVKDIADVAAKNQASIAKASYGDNLSAPPHPDPNNGYGSGALAQKPTARQPPGDQALNAPNRSSSGGSDPNVADPDAPQLRGSKQFTAQDGAGAVTDLAYGWGDLDALIEMSAETGRLAVTPAPRGKPGGPGLYRQKGNMHSPYMQQIVKALIEKRGMDPGKAYAIAWGAMRKWSKGGGKVHPEVRAAAAGGLALEKVAEARAHAHAVTWDDVVGAITLTGDAQHRHIPGSPMDYEHNYVPLTEAAAASHFKGSVPKGWHPKGGGGGKAAGPHHLKFTDTSGRVSYHTVHDEETAGNLRKQAAARKMTVAEGGSARDPSVGKMPKNAQAMHDAALQAGWNVSHYPGHSTDFKFDAQGHEIPGSSTQLHSVSAHNPVTGKTVRQSWTGNKVGSYNQKEPLQASIAAIKASPVSPADLRDMNTPAGRQRRLASRIASDGQEFSARGSGTNADKVGYEMYQASQALSAGDRQAAIGHLRTAQTASVTGHEVMARGTGYASQVIAKHLKALGVQDQQYSVTWDDLAGVLDLAAAPSTAGGGPASSASAASSSSSGSPQARVPAGQAGGGQFGSGSGQPTAAQAHAAHVAHVAHVTGASTQKAALLVTAADDRQKAAALIKQRDALVKALASAGGAVSSGQAGAKTASTATTKTSAPATTATASTAPAAASATAASTAPAKASTAKAAAAPAASGATGSASAMKAQVAALNTQISGLLAQAAQATAQAAAMK